MNQGDTQQSTPNSDDIRKARQQKLMARLEQKYKGDSMDTSQENLQTDINSSTVEKEQIKSNTTTTNITSNEFTKKQEEEINKDSISGTEKLQLMKKRERLVVKYEGISITISALIGLSLTLFTYLGVKAVDFSIIFLGYQMIYQFLSQKVLYSRLDSQINTDKNGDSMFDNLGGKAGKAINIAAKTMKYGKIFRQIADDTSMFIFTFVISSSILQFF